MTAENLVLMKTNAAVDGVNPFSGLFPHPLSSASIFYNVSDLNGRKD